MCASHNTSALAYIGTAKFTRSIMTAIVYRFETDNGIKQEEVGYLKAGPSGEPVSVVQGQSSYVGTDGQTYLTGYTADERGYQAYGSHLPTPPPIPVEIQESLRLLASLPSTPEPAYN